MNKDRKCTKISWEVCWSVWCESRVLQRLMPLREGRNIVTKWDLSFASTFDSPHRHDNVQNYNSHLCGHDALTKQRRTSAQNNTLSVWGLLKMPAVFNKVPLEEPNRNVVQVNPFNPEVSELWVSWSNPLVKFMFSDCVPNVLRCDAQWRCVAMCTVSSMTWWSYLRLEESLPTPTTCSWETTWTEATTLWRRSRCWSR